MSDVFVDSLTHDSRTVLARARSAFVREIGVARWASVAPGRVNLIGEHIDYNDGFVLPMAIDRVCVALASPARDPAACRVCAIDKRESAVIDMTTGNGPAPARGSWLSYIEGVVRVYQREFGAAKIVPMDIAVASSVPLGSGLSSSASLELAVATVIERAAGIPADPRRKALLCQRAEHEFAGVPCGIMDQFISSLGERDSALLIDCATAQSTTIPMPGPEHAAVLIVNTNVHHELAGGEYAARRATCERALRAIGASRWREVELQDLEHASRRLEALEFRCARHVVTEIARTLGAAEALRSGPDGLAKLGGLMNESHESLRDDYRVSCPELDAVVEIARSSSGVFGSRMTGGGFGGCAIALVRPDAVAEVTTRINREYLRRFGRESTSFVTTASAGARSVALAP